MLSKLNLNFYCPLESVINVCGIMPSLRNSVNSVQNLNTEGRWFDPRLGQYSFRGLAIVIATGLFFLSPLSIVSKMVMWESSQLLENNIVLKKIKRKRC